MQDPFGVLVKNDFAPPKSGDGETKMIIVFHKSAGEYTIIPCKSGSKGGEVNTPNQKEFPFKDETDSLTIAVAPLPSGVPASQIYLPKIANSCFFPAAKTAVPIIHKVENESKRTVLRIPSSAVSWQFEVTYPKKRPTISEKDSVSVGEDEDF